MCVSCLPLHSWSLSTCSLRQECEVEQFIWEPVSQEVGDREVRHRRDSVGEAGTCGSAPQGPSGTRSCSAASPRPATGHQSLGAAFPSVPLSQLSPMLPSRPMGLGYTSPCPSHGSCLGSLCSLHGSHVCLLCTHTCLRRPS